jgi:hypothetical protein
MQCGASVGTRLTSLLKRTPSKPENAHDHTRFQEGTLGIEGKGSTAHYYTRFRVYDADGKSKRKQVTIGLVSKMSKREATKQKAQIVTQQTSQLPRSPLCPEGRDDLR